MITFGTIVVIVSGFFTGCKGITIDYDIYNDIGVSGPAGGKLEKYRVQGRCRGEDFDKWFYTNELVKQEEK